MKKNLLLFFALAATGATQVAANNLDIGNVSIVPVNRRVAIIEMDLSWENSWHDECNHDAAWLFAKYSVDDGSTWRHATLKGSGVDPALTSPGTNSLIELYVPQDGRGAFVRRRGLGNGNLATTGLRLVWDLEADGIPREALGRVSMHGLEMVYIPQGAYYVGDDASQIFSGFKVTHINTPDISKTSAQGLGTIAAPYTNLTTGIGRPYSITGVFTNLYPNGYNAYYIMKYELSRARYLDFLNQLSHTQATNLLAKQSSFQGTSGAISGTHPNLFNAHAWRAVLFGEGNNPPSYSGSQEWLAYLDWAGLRPMTELEYEKSCRGPHLPVDNGFPWGTTAGLLVNRLKDVNTTAESPLVSEAALVAGGYYGGVINSWPLRNGAAADAESDQFQAGASYYGVMEMAGNVCEKCVSSFNNAVARTFSGLHGDGELNANGMANVPDWPYQTGVSYGGGSIISRGGGFQETVLNCTISSKGAHNGDNYYPAAKHGIRGVRSVP